MHRLAVAIVLSSAVFAQTTPKADIALAVKSPYTLAGYLESHRTVDWKALRSALGLPESRYWFAPCGSDAPANDTRCSADTVAVADPEQRIVVIQGDYAITDEYLRYLQGPNGTWKFGSENCADKRFGPSGHSLVRLGDKPFLKISSNHNQDGFAIGQEVEDWFDLTLPRFEPVFSFTSEGNAGGFNYTIPRDMRAESVFERATPVERIETSLNVEFSVTPGLDVRDCYVGVYERNLGEKKFKLRAAYSCTDRNKTIPAKDFEDLSDPLVDPAKGTFMKYAHPGLKKIAAGSNPEERGWLRDVLTHARDTPEKRMLVKLLGKP